MLSGNAPPPSRRGPEDTSKACEELIAFTSSATGRGGHASLSPLPLEIGHETMPLREHRGTSGQSGST